MSNNSGPGRSHHGGALENALSWPWGILGSCGALGSEALEVAVSGDILEDPSKESAGGGVSGTPGKGVGRSAPGRRSATSGSSPHCAPGSEEHEKINLQTRHSTQTSEEGVPKGTPKTESEDSQYGRAWERVGEGSRRAIGRPPDGRVSI